MEEKLVQQSNFFKYWNVAGRNEEIDTSVNKDDENITENQLYFPERTCHLWSRLMTSVIKKKEAAAISKEIIVQNIMEDINTIAQEEDCFSIKKNSSFKKKDVSICKFLKRNYEGNTALQRETVDVCLREISRHKKSVRKKEDRCVINNQ